MTERKGKNKVTIWPFEENFTETGEFSGYLGQESRRK